MSGTRETAINLLLWLLRLGRIAWFVCCTAALYALYDTFMELHAHPEQYSGLWGGEGHAAGGWRYSSESVYQVFLGVEATWFFLGALICLAFKPLRHTILFPIHLFITVFYFLYTPLLGSALMR